MSNYTDQLTVDTRFEMQVWIQDLNRFARNRDKTIMEQRIERLIRKLLQEK
jgi:hypothetical protein